MVIGALAKQLMNGTVDISYMRNLKCPHAQIQYLDNRLEFGGAFILGQVFLDMGYCGITQYTGDDFVVVGPGAYRGIQYLTGTDQNGVNVGAAAVDKKGRPFVEIIHANQETFWKLLKKNTGKDWQDVCLDNPRYPVENRGNLSRMDIQNCLCEFRKYSNLKNGTKKSAQKFVHTN